MTPEQSRAAAEVMLAYANGKCIEWRMRGSNDWEYGVDHLDVCWNWRSYEYRAKPEPFSGWFVVSGNTVTRICDSLADAMAEKAMIGGRVVKLVEVEE